MSAPADDEAYHHYVLLCNKLREAGYEHYEVSNFCLPGYEAVHNSAYWAGIPYLGIGPSAHSYCDGKRSWNVSNNRKYVLHIESGDISTESEVLDNKDLANEMIMTGLRNAGGIELPKLLELGYPEEGISSKLRAFEEKSWLILGDGTFRPTEEGFWWSDHMSSQLFWVD